MGSTWETLLLLALGAITIFVVLTWAHLRYWSRRLTLTLDYRSTEELVAPDGAAIELRRVPLPDGVPEAELPPVLLVHGLGANHRNQDLHPDYSLARYLAGIGRDVWLLTLRSGHKPRSRADRRRMRFEAMVAYDVPMGVSAVLERTGASSLDYVGFSMGGMLLYAALGRSVPEASLRRAVIVGSPGAVMIPRRLRTLVRRWPRALVPTLPLRFGARVIAFASEWVKTPLHAISANPYNLSPGITRAALINVVEDIPGPLYADFMSWAAAGGDLSTGGARALDGLARVRVPALFVAGTADKLAPIPSVRRAFEAWAKERPETPKRFIVVGRDFGHHEDYGHGDMAMGVHVGVELFEPIAKFLGPEEQAGEAPGAESGAAAREDIREREALPGEGGERS